ncbi:hypothetical protein [Methylobacterium indicum]|uniref:hypothetical protein n=1 Tax=Methylobacterium indicum TaxID=1775910 RepID=UPI000B0120F2|nr:hypothetical protein [Methylobacterium indicum]
MQPDAARSTRILLALGTGLVLAGFGTPEPARARSADVPAFPIRAMCRPDRTAGSGIDDPQRYRGCLADERSARAILRQRWRHFPAADRRDCVRENDIGAPSYVALLTCLQLSDDALPGQPPPLSGSKQISPNWTPVRRQKSATHQ